MEGIHTDVEILLECVKCQLSDPDSLKSSLVTLASVLTSNDTAKESFRDLGGLKYVFNLILRTENLSVKHSGLFCLACAVEKSVFAQKCLSQQSSFEFVHKTLSDTTSSTKMKQTAVFFLLCLVANNGLGQNLARQTGCLADLMEMCKALIIENQSSLIAGNAWTIVNSAISVCVNNPQNEKNQHLSSTLFPHLFKLIQDHLNPELLKPALSLMGLAVANNVLNQDRVRRCGGLDTLVSSLGKCMGYSILHEPGLAIPIISTIDSCITDNDTNCMRFGELGGINLLLETLRQPELDQQENLQVILTLGHTLDTSAENQSYVDNRGYQTLVKLLTEAQDEELIKALKYTLNLCQKEGQIDRHFISDSIVENSERQQGGLILEKISELTAKLKSFEKESRQETKELSNLVENQNKKTDAENNSKRHQLPEETKTCQQNLEHQQPSRTETLLQQLIGLFGSSQTPEKAYRTTSNAYPSWQDNQYTPIKNIQSDCHNQRISSHKQALSHSIVNVDHDVRMAADNSQDLSFESAQRKSANFKEFELVGQSYLQSESSFLDHYNCNSSDSVNLSKNVADKHKCNQYNLLKNDDKTTLRQMERNMQKNCHDQHVNTSHDINNNACSHPMTSRNNVNVFACLPSEIGNQNTDLQQLRNNQSSDSMVLNSNGVPSFIKTKEAHLCDSYTISQNRMHNQSTCSGEDIFGHTKSCNCDVNNNQFSKCNEDGNFNEPHRIMCHNVNENESNLIGRNRGMYTNHSFVCRGKDQGLRFCKSCTNSNYVSCNIYDSKMSTNHQESQDYLPEKETSVNHTANQLQCGCSKPERQSKNLRSSNQCSTCHDGISTVQTAMDNAGQNISQNKCSSHRELNHMSSQKEQCKNAPHSLVTIRIEDDQFQDDDDNQWCRPSEQYRLLGQNDAIQKLSDCGSDTPAERNTLNSLLKERQLKIHTLQDRLTDHSIKVTKILSAGNEDSTCDIFLTEKDGGISEYSSNKMFGYSQTKKANCFTPKVKHVNEKERAKSVSRLCNNNIKSRDITTDKDESWSEQGSIICTPKLRQRLHSTEKQCPTNSDSLKTCNTMMDTFVKPNAVPLRRKIVTPSSCGSGINSAGRRNNVRVFSKKPTVGIQVKPVIKDKLRNRLMDSSIKQKQHIEQPPPSPVTSEFDFGLLTSAKRNAWQFQELSGPCTPVVQRLSVDKFKSFTIARCIKKPTYNPAYSLPMSEQCVDYSDSESFSSLESESTNGSQKTNDGSENISVASTFNRVQPMKTKNSLCPGCNSSEQINGAILNSRTFNIALETSINTCSRHRNIRQLERNFIQKTKESIYAELTASKKQRPLRASVKEWIYKQKLYVDEQKKPLNVYDFHGSSSDSESTSSKLYVSPPHSTKSSVHPLQRYRNKIGERRQRIPYSEEELEFLKHGVEHLGKKWNQILVTYKFHPSRTAVDLMEKHKRLSANKSKKSVRAKCSKAFSMCEERRLIRGVKTFGYNWKGILHAFKFSKDRSAEDLRNKWRRLNRH